MAAGCARAAAGDAVAVAALAVEVDRRDRMAGRQCYELNAPTEEKRIGAAGLIQQQIGMLLVRPQPAWRQHHRHKFSHCRPGRETAGVDPRAGSQRFRWRRAHQPEQSECPICCERCAGIGTLARTAIPRLERRHRPGHRHPRLDRRLRRLQCGRDRDSRRHYRDRYPAVSAASFTIER
jgi:hypothetical protein